jgi:hypothetical protein
MPKPYRGAKCDKLHVFRGQDVQAARPGPGYVQDGRIKLAQEFAQVGSTSF